MKGLVLVPVCEEDAHILFEWANDPQTRANAFNSERIEYQTHIKWLKQKLEDQNAHLFLCKNETVPVGHIRIDLENTNAIISYSIDNKFRGKGLGTAMLELIEDYAKHELTVGEDGLCLIGLVKYENIASQRCFEKNWYTKEEQKDYIKYKKMVRRNAIYKS